MSDEEVADYYANNQQQFRRPEQVKARYLVLSLDSLTDEVTVTEEEVRSLYEQRAKELAKEERRAAHILIEDGAEASKTMD
ncbi:peptidylprolyl isomerase, partial [Enterococcus hirae]